MQRNRSQVFRTAIGWVGVALSDRGVLAIVLPQKRKSDALRELDRVTDNIVTTKDRARSSPKALQRAVKGLQQFFSGVPGRVALTLDLRGHTEFQQAVWRAAQRIPYGETRSYGWIAKRIGKPGAGRAVGRAMGANPVPILVP